MAGGRVGRLLSLLAIAALAPRSRRTARERVSPPRRRWWSTIRSSSIPLIRQRAFDTTSGIVDHAIYESLFTYRKNDFAHPLPLLVRSGTSRGAKTFTFRLRRDVHFADGTPLTSADVVFSLRRLVNLKGNPAFLLSGVNVSARDKYTVVLRLEHACCPAAVHPRDSGDGHRQLEARQVAWGRRRGQRIDGR